MTSILLTSNEYGEYDIIRQQFDRALNS